MNAIYSIFSPSLLMISPTYFSNSIEPYFLVMNENEALQQYHWGANRHMLTWHHYYPLSSVHRTESSQNNVMQYIEICMVFHGIEREKNKIVCSTFTLGICRFCCCAAFFFIQLFKYTYTCKILYNWWTNWFGTISVCSLVNTSHAIRRTHAEALNSHSGQPEPSIRNCSSRSIFLSNLNRRRNRSIVFTVASKKKKNRIKIELRSPSHVDHF